MDPSLLNIVDTVNLGGLKQDGRPSQIWQASSHLEGGVQVLADLYTACGQGQEAGVMVRCYWPLVSHLLQPGQVAFEVPGQEQSSSIFQKHDKSYSGFHWHCPGHVLLEHPSHPGDLAP